MRKSILLLPAVAAATAFTAQAAQLVSIPFNFTGTLPQTLQNFDSTNASFVDEIGITGNFMNASNSGSMTAGSALSFSISGGNTIAAGASGLSLTAGTNNFTSVAYSSAITGQTVYVSFLYKTDSTTNRFILSTGNGSAVNTPSTSGTPRFDLNGTNMVVDAAGTGANSASAATLAADTTYLVVGRINWDGSKYASMDLWVNPAYNSGVAPAPTVSTAANGTATSLSSPVFRAVTGSMSVDNFVIGTTWNDVMGNGALPSPPAAPSGLTVGSPTSSSLTLNWTDNSNNETGFKIERSADGSAPWALVTTTAADAVTYTNTGLSSSTTYYYRVTATNAGGDSSPTSTVSGTTSAPPPSAFPVYDSFATSQGYSITAGGDSAGRLPNQTGLSTANGLVSAWTTVAGATVNYLYRAAGALSYSGLTTSGDGGIQFTPGDDAFRDARRDLVTTVTTANSTAIYLSFLLKTPADAVDVDGTASVFFRANTANSTGFGAGIANGELAMQWRDIGGGLNYLSLDSTANPGNPVAYAPGTTYLFVVKATENGTDWGGTDTQTVWVNPTDFTSESTLSSSALATLTKTDTYAVGTSTATGAVSFMSQNLSGAGVMYVDEIRVGETVASVLPAGATNTPAEDWFISFSLPASTSLGADGDNDGLNNALEFVLGGNPTTNDTPSVRPTVNAAGSDLVLTFKRSDESQLQPISVKVQTSTNLSGWSDFATIGATNGSGYTVAENGSAADTIVVTIPKGVDTKKFARVVATY